MAFVVLFSLYLASLREIMTDDQLLKSALGQARDTKRLTIASGARHAVGEMFGGLFGESASRVVVSVAPGDAEQVLARASAAGVPARAIGSAGGDRIRIAVNGRQLVDVVVGEAEEPWATAIGRRFVRRAA